MVTKKNSGFTLAELLIIIALIGIIAVAVLTFLNPLQQINKANDGKRKAELSTMRKVFEDWYNDKNCYPKPDEVCSPSSEVDYNPATNKRCYFCGDDNNSPSLSPYLSRLPCDPNHPNKKYLYEVDNSQCPSKYWIYSNLTNKGDSDIALLGCQNGCGPVDNCNFNYGVASPNTMPSNCVVPTSTPPSPTPTSPPYTPTPTIPLPTPTPEGSYYCQSFGNCVFYNNQVWTCNPAFFDPQCIGSNNCTTTGSCQRK